MKLNAREQEVYDLWSQLPNTKVLRNGWPDFLIIGERSVRGLEIKAPGAKLTPQQEAMHAALRSAGIPVDVVEVGDDFLVGLVTNLRAMVVDLRAVASEPAAGVVES